PAGPARSSLRALLHDAGARHGPRPRRGAADRRGARWSDRRRRWPGRGRALHQPFAGGGTGGGGGMTPRVLVVDDEERIAAVVADALERGGSECVVCGSGEGGGRGGGARGPDSGVG